MRGAAEPKWASSCPRRRQTVSLGRSMNLWIRVVLWIAAIAIFVLLEKTVPFGVASGRVAGVVMIVVGALTLAL